MASSPVAVAWRKAPGGGCTVSVAGDPANRCETGDSRLAISGTALPSSGCQAIRGIAAPVANSARIARSRATSAPSVASSRSGPLSSRFTSSEPDLRRPCRRARTGRALVSRANRVGSRMSHVVRSITRSLPRACSPSVSPSGRRRTARSMRRRVRGALCAVATMWGMEKPAERSAASTTPRFQSSDAAMSWCCSTQPPQRPNRLHGGSTRSGLAARTETVLARLRPIGSARTVSPARA